MSIMPNQSQAAPPNPLRIILFWLLMAILATAVWKLKPKESELELGMALFLVSSVALFLWRKIKEHRRVPNNSGPIHPTNRPIG
jgi:tryptophan-rich sensory protein